MEVNNQGVRCVHTVTGEVITIGSFFAYNKSWQKSTKYKPQPEPVKEDFKPITTQAKPASKDLKETKPDTNAKPTETTTNDGSGRNATSSNAGRS